jgi:hypothetical protein
MGKFRKKPVVVEAIQITEPLIWDWLDGGRKSFAFGLHPSVSWHDGNRKIHSFRISIKTLEGVMHASIGDWIIRGVKGELYPCKPDTFEATYEPA